MHPFCLLNRLQVWSRPTVILAAGQSMDVRNGVVATGDLGLVVKWANYNGANGWSNAERAKPGWGFVDLTWCYLTCYQYWCMRSLWTSINEVSDSSSSSAASSSSTHHHLRGIIQNHQVIISSPRHRPRFISTSCACCAHPPVPRRHSGWRCVAAKMRRWTTRCGRHGPSWGQRSASVEWRDGRMVNNISIIYVDIFYLYII